MTGDIGTVLCSRQRPAYRSEADALARSEKVDRFPSAYECPVCGFWHAGPLHRHCSSRKVGHTSIREAQWHADRLNADPDGFGTNYPYRCDECGQWHNGRPHKGKMLQ